MAFHSLFILVVAHKGITEAKVLLLFFCLTSGALISAGSLALIPPLLMLLSPFICATFGMACIAMETEI